MARILEISPVQPQKRRIEQAVRTVQRGGVIILPTDTVYGLGASLRFPVAIERIYKLKKRSRGKPLVRLIASYKDMEGVLFPSPVVRGLIKNYWPGPLTLIFRTKTGEKVGYRIPRHRVILEILRKTGPLAVTSANLSGKKSALSVHEIDRRIRDKVDTIVDSGPCPLGQESMILDVSSLPFRIVRKGTIKDISIEIKQG